MKYSMTCSCGHVMETEATTREEAVANIKGMMTEEAITAHMGEKHAGEPVLSKAEVDAMVEQSTVQM